jgi:hypothetical protein
MKPVDELTVDEFSQWFSRGFEQFFTPHERHKAFVGSDIRLDRPVITELERIYAALQPNVRKRFREGLAVVPRVISPLTPLYLKSVYQAVSLAARIGSAEMLPVIHSELNVGSLRTAVAGERKQTQLAAWNYIASLAPHPTALQYVRAAYNRTDLDSSLMQLLFLAQCRARPNQFAKLFVEFAERLETAKLKTLDWNSLIYSILNVVGLQIFAAQLHRLPYKLVLYNRLFFESAAIEPDDFGPLLFWMFAQPSSSFHLQCRLSFFALERWKIVIDDSHGKDEAIIELSSLSHLPYSSVFQRLLYVCKTEREARELVKTSSTRTAEMLKSVLTWRPPVLQTA